MQVLRLSGSVISLGMRISTGSRPLAGSGDDLGVSALSARLTSSSRRLFRFSGSKILPPRRKLEGNTESQSELTRLRLLKAGCLKPPPPPPTLQLAAGVGRAAAEPRAHLGAQLGDSRGPPTEHRTPLKEGPGLTQQDCPNRWGRKVLFSLLPPLPTLWGPWGVPREITISEGHYRGDSAGLNTGRAVGRSELTDSIWKRPVGLGPWAPRWVLAGRPPRFGSWRGSDEHAGDKATGRRWELASALGPHKP